jgi:hypothetical protein
MLIHGPDRLHENMLFLNPDVKIYKLNPEQGKCTRPQVQMCCL